MLTQVGSHYLLSETHCYFSCSAFSEQSVPFQILLTNVKEEDEKAVLEDALRPPSPLHMKPQSTNKPISEAPGPPFSSYHHTDTLCQPQDNAGDNSSPFAVTENGPHSHTWGPRDPVTTTNSLVQTASMRTSATVPVIAVNGCEAPLKSSVPHNTPSSPAHFSARQTPSISDHSNSGEGLQNLPCPQSLHGLTHTPHSHASDACQKSLPAPSRNWSCRSLERPDGRPTVIESSPYSPADLRSPSSPCPPYVSSPARDQRPDGPMPVERWAENVNRYYNSQNCARSGRGSPCEELSELDSLYQASLKAPSMPRALQGPSPQLANKSGNCEQDLTEIPYNSLLKRSATCKKKTIHFSYLKTY